MATNTHNGVLSKFLDRWTDEQVYRLGIEDYIDSNRGYKDTSREGTTDTFCYWVDSTFSKLKSFGKRNTSNNDYTFSPALCSRYGIVLNRSFSNFHLKKKPIGKNRANQKEELLFEHEWKSDPSLLTETGENEDGFYEDDDKISEQGFEIREFDQIDEEGGSNYETADWATYEIANPDFYFPTKNLLRDADYTWLRKYGDHSAQAFHNIHKQVMEVVEGALKRDFDWISTTSLPDTFALRIAYLYSEDSIVPIFKRSTLQRCAFNLGFTSGDSDWLSLQRFVLKKKPYDFVDHFDYARYLLGTLSDNPPGLPAIANRSRSRKPVTGKSVKPYTRAMVESYSVEQRHNLIQNELYRRLKAQYGDNVVRLEEDFVDIKLYLETEIVFYEVKSDLNASICIRNAIGQVLHYVHLDPDSRRKRIVVVGPAPPNQSDRLFIEFLKSILEIDFDYENVSLGPAD